MIKKKQPPKAGTKPSPPKGRVRATTYKSGFEKRFQEKTRELGYELPYEERKLKYTIPQATHSYTPDFEVTRNVFIETKGIWSVSDRKKALLIKEQHPSIKILYVLYKDQRLYKKADTTYLEWAKKHGLECCTFANEQYWKDFIQHETYLATRT